MKKIILAALVLMLAVVSGAMACNCPAGCSLGDVYATSVVSAVGVNHADRALGEPNFNYAEISNGESLVLDMGKEICDSNEMDIYFYNDYSNENVNVDTSLNGVDWTRVATNMHGFGTQSVELAGTGSTIRYVKISPGNGGQTVEIDAVMGKCSKALSEVPEFGIIGALVVLAGAGLFIFSKRRN
jgi:hypothetical protein